MRCVCQSEPKSLTVFTSVNARRFSVRTRIPRRRGEISCLRKNSPIIATVFCPRSLDFATVFALFLAEIYPSRRPFVSGLCLAYFSFFWIFSVFFSLRSAPQCPPDSTRPPMFILTPGAPAPGFRLRASGSGRPAPVSRLRPSGFRLPALAFRLRATPCR